MILDQKMWAQVDFARELLDYMAKHGTSARMQDQDFLNCFFQDRWTELSPRFNYQKAHFNYGYERVFPPVFLHFSSFQKPWLQPDSLDSVHGQFFAPYQEMFAQAGVDYRDYLRRRPESALRKLRTQAENGSIQHEIVGKAFLVPLRHAGAHRHRRSDADPVSAGRRDIPGESAGERRSDGTRHRSGARRASCFGYE